MKRFSEQFKKQSEGIRMRASERNTLRERLVSYMEYHPLPVEMQTMKTARSPRTEGILSEPFKVLRFNKIYVRSFVGIFALLIIVSVPVVADNALPGDVLYPVKIDFNEQLRSTLALSPYAKVQWETETLERRISEARLLANEGKLTPETETQVAQSVKDHADAAQQDIAQLRQNDSDGAAIAEIALSSALDVQSEVLAGSAQDTDQSVANQQDGHSVAVLAQVVAQARDSVQAAQSQSTQPSYGTLLTRIQQESTHTSELFALVKTEASPEEVSAVERSLADIQRKVDQAKAIKDGTASTSLALVTLDMSLPIEASTSDASNTPSNELGTTTLTSLATDTSDMATSSEVTTVETASSTSTSTASADATIATSTTASTTPQAAIDLLRSALGDLQKVSSYLTNIDVRQTVSLQDLVPVTPTSQERMAEISKLYDETRDMQSKILNATYDSDTEAKVVLGQNEIETDLTEVVGAVKKGDFDTALSAVTNAHDTATELSTFSASDKIVTTSDTAVSATNTDTTQQGTSTVTAE